MSNNYKWKWTPPYAKPTLIVKSNFFRYMTPKEYKILSKAIKGVRNANRDTKAND